MTQDQILAFVQLVVNDYIANNPHKEDYNKQGYLFYCYDYCFMAMMYASIIIVVLTYRSLVLENASQDLMKAITRITGIQQVMKNCLTNSLYTIYFESYYHSLDNYRFNNFQHTLSSYRMCTLHSISPLNLAFFSIQLSLFFLEANEVLSLLFKFMADGLLIDEDEKSIPVGKKRILCYFVCVLLVTCYNHNGLQFKQESCVKQNVLFSGSIMREFDYGTILQNINCVLSNEKALFDIIESICNKKVSKGVVLYSLKKSMIPTTSIFDQFTSLLQYYEVIQVYPNDLLLFIY